MIGGTRVEHPIGRRGGRGRGIGNIGLKIGGWQALVIGIGFIPKVFLCNMPNSALGLRIGLVIWFSTIEGSFRSLVLLVVLLDMSILGVIWSWRIGLKPSLVNRSVLVVLSWSRLVWVVGGSGLVIVSGSGLIVGIGIGMVLLVWLRSSNKSSEIVWRRERTVVKRYLTLHSRLVTEKVAVEVSEGEGRVSARDGDWNDKGIVLRAKSVEYRHNEVIIWVKVADEGEFIS